MNTLLAVLSAWNPTEESFTKFFVGTLDSVKQPELHPNDFLSDLVSKIPGEMRKAWLSAVSQSHDLGRGLHACK